MIRVCFVKSIFLAVAIAKVNGILSSIFMQCRKRQNRRNQPNGLLLQFGNYVYRFNDSGTPNQPQSYLLDNEHWHHLYFIHRCLFHWGWNDTVSDLVIHLHLHVWDFIFPFWFYLFIHFEFRTKEKSIYRLLDWRKPGKAIVVSLACLFSVFVVHLVVYCLYRCRVFIFKKFCMRQSTLHQYAMGDDQIIIRNQQTQKIVRTPTSYDESKPEQFFNPSTVVELKWTGTLYHAMGFNIVLIFIW